MATAVNPKPYHAATHVATRTHATDLQINKVIPVSPHDFNAVAGADLDTLSNSSLLAIMELHILPPVPVLLAPWTTPFFAANPSLPTWLGPNLTATSVSSG